MFGVIPGVLPSIEPVKFLALIIVLIAGSFFNFIGARSLELRCARLVVKLRILLALCVLCASVANSFGMDRFAALSQIESSDNDFAIGPCHEVSRYQILPSVAAVYDRRSPMSKYRTRAFALSIA